ncbi:MAG: DUF5640 domain-containing protein [Eubacterium sp.]
MEFDFDKFDDSKKKASENKLDELEPPKNYKNTEADDKEPESKDDNEPKANAKAKAKAKKSPKKGKQNKSGKGKNDETVTLSFTFKKLSPKQIVAIIVVAVLLIVCVPTGIYCGVHQETPFEMLHDIFTEDEKQIIGKWQSNDSKSGYQFNEDGTVFAYNGVLGDKNAITYNYTLKGKKITLSNRSYNYTSEFEYSLNGSNLEMTLIKVNDAEVSDQEKFVFSKVDYFNISSLMDTLADAANADKPAIIVNNGEDVVLGESDVYLKQYAEAQQSGDAEAIEVLEDDERIVFAKDGTEITVKDVGDEYSSVKIEKGRLKGNLYYVSNENIQYE